MMAARAYYSGVERDSCRQLGRFSLANIAEEEVCMLKYTKSNF